MKNKTFLDLEPMQRLLGESDVTMTFGVCYHAAESILDELETTKFILGKTKRVAIIQFRMNRCCG